MCQLLFSSCGISLVQSLPWAMHQIAIKREPNWDRCETLEDMATPPPPEAFPPEFSDMVLQMWQVSKGDSDGFASMCTAMAATLVPSSSSGANTSSPSGSPGPPVGLADTAQRRKFDVFGCSFARHVCLDTSFVSVESLWQAPDQVGESSLASLSAETLQLPGAMLRPIAPGATQPAAGVTQPAAANTQPPDGAVDSAETVAPLLPAVLQAPAEVQPAADTSVEMPGGAAVPLSTTQVVAEAPCSPSQAATGVQPAAAVMQPVAAGTQNWMFRASTSESLAESVIEDQLATANSADAEMQARRSAHAMYMRFWRSVSTHTKSTPESVILTVSKLRSSCGNKKLRSNLTGLYEDWIQAKEQWLRTVLLVHRNFHWGPCHCSFDCSHTLGAAAAVRHRVGGQFLPQLSPGKAPPLALDDQGRTDAQVRGRGCSG